MKFFILDVDGVMTDGKFYYTKDGKVFKAFGPDDNDALGLISKFVKVLFVTGDKKGFDISKRRINDMGYELNLVSTISRIDWIRNLSNPSEVIYMGDGIFDFFVMQECGYSIAPSNADQNTKNEANFVTKRIGGDRAVSEACLHLLNHFFNWQMPRDKKQIQKIIKGEWAI